MKHQRFQFILAALTALACLTALPTKAQFTGNNGAITSYTRSGGNVVIPTSTNVWPVTGIATAAFINETN